MEMNQEILEYIQQNRICVLAVEMLDGAPHAATVHYAHAQTPLRFFFETNRAYRKAEPLLAHESTRASVVIGFEESAGKTLQLDGEVRVIADSEQDMFDSIYLGKFPEKAKKMSDPATKLCLVFTPTWWRYTNFKGPDGKLIISSTDND